MHHGCRFLPSCCYLPTDVRAFAHTRIHTHNLPLEVWSMSPPGGATRYSEKIDELTDPPYSSVQQRDFFLSAHIGKLKHGKIKNSNPTTPDLVQSLNELNRTSTTILPPIANARRNESYNKASASVPAHRRSLLPLHTTFLAYLLLPSLSI